MKKVGVFLLVVGILFSGYRIYQRVDAKYEYQSKIGNNWELADRAATLSQKSEYIDKYVNALSKENLEETYDALFYPNAENAFDENMKALKSLQGRLKDISKMDENSFAYQTALHQITEQEQGQAQGLTETLKNCWYKQHHYTLWNGLLFWLFLAIEVILICLGLIFGFDLDFDGVY